jgi:di/tricarboxylate transporter
VCTLIGTSTNILVSDIARRSGQAPFAMFEFTPLGLWFGAVAVFYLAFVAPFLLRGVTAPAHRSLRERYAMHRWLFELVVEEGSPLVGATLEELTRHRRFEVEVLEILRGPDVRFLPGRDDVLRAGDVLLVLGPIPDLLKTRAIPGLALRRDLGTAEGAGEGEDVVLIEAVVPPASSLVGRTLEDVRFRQVHRCQALAIRHHERIEHGKVGRIRLAVGDLLLLQGRRADLDELRDGKDLILIEEVPLRGIEWRRALPAMAVVFAVVAGAAAGFAPILVTALAGCAALVLARIITIEEAYGAIDWKVIFLLAGVIPLGTALQQTGAAALLGDGLVRLAGDLGPVALLSAFYLGTTLLTEMMSNNAAAALLAPLAIATAGSLGVDARPLLVAIMFGASTSFVTPVGYQTNAMVLGPGGYRFRDFTRVGLPLNVAFWLLATWLIPRYFPF